MCMSVWPCTSDREGNFGMLLYFGDLVNLGQNVYIKTCQYQFCSVLMMSRDRFALRCVCRAHGR